MNRIASRLALAAVGVGALTGLAAGVAQADTPGGAYEGSGTGSEGTADAAQPSGATPNYVLQEAPGLPIGNLTLIDAAAPVYGALG